MSAAQGVLATVLGASHESAKIERRPSPATPFELFQVELTAFNGLGLPSTWYFAIHAPPSPGKSGSPAAILDAAYKQIADRSRDDLLVLVSTEQAVHLGDEFNNSPGHVFWLDALELHSAPAKTDLPRLSPLAFAVRRRLSKPPVYLAVMPYLRGKPAVDWHFFGRVKELDQLVHGRENFVVVGARRIGKTSLLKEAERRLRRQSKPSPRWATSDLDPVYYVSVEECRDEGAVVKELIRLISPRELARVYGHKDMLGESTLENILRRLSKSSFPIVLLIDELGNVIREMPGNTWPFLGVMRKYSGPDSKLRIIFSCFNDVYFRFQQEFTGPIVNFGQPLRIAPFSRRDVDAFVKMPLEFWWNPTPAALDEVAALVWTRVGRHPYFLQHFCFALFATMSETPNPDALAATRRLLDDNLSDWTSDAVLDIFEPIKFALLKYLFLLRCVEAADTRAHLTEAALDDDWLTSRLAHLGFQAPLDARRAIAETLEMHSLTIAVDAARQTWAIASPVIYEFYRRSGIDMRGLLRKFAADVPREASHWGLASK